MVFGGTGSAFYAIIRHFGADLTRCGFNLHRFFAPRREAQANRVRLSNSQAEKKSFSHALYPSNR